MIRNGNWANFALRCDEAALLRERAIELPRVRAVEPGGTGRSPFERSLAERRDSALGLARFKVAQRLTEQALALAQQFGLSSAELGLALVEPVSGLSPQAA